jgi:hypothetical protein
MERIRRGGITVEAVVDGSGASGTLFVCSAMAMSWIELEKSEQIDVGLSVHRC